ncbi:MAG: LytTR family transcriptional regulator [Saprospiraceae bacterium]|nr:LytTR family transcriptional regulator [Saprospiraceae bacterium]
MLTPNNDSTSLGILIIEGNASKHGDILAALSEHYNSLNTIAVLKADVAAQILEKSPKFDFVIIDINASEAFELSEKLKNCHVTRNTFIIDLNQPDDFKEKLRSIVRSFNPFLTKNAQVDEHIEHGTTEKIKTKNDDEQKITSYSTPSVFIPMAQQMKELIQLSDIVYIKAQESCSLIHLQSGRVLTAFRILGYFKKMLIDNPDFVQIHHALIFNKQYLKFFQYQNQ